jgi:lipopolysaccharide export LptBFGC system permease protein LptF
MNYEDIAKGISIISPFALIILILAAIIFWLLWKVIPNMQAHFEAMLEKSQKINERQGDDFRIAISNLQNSFLETLAKERHAYANALNVAIASNVAIEKSVDRLTTAVLSQNKKP